MHAACRQRFLAERNVVLLSTVKKQQRTRSHPRAGRPMEELHPIRALYAAHTSSADVLHIHASLNVAQGLECTCLKS